MCPLNYDGEDGDNWGAFYYLIGDARKSIIALVALVERVVPMCVEKWTAVSRAVEREIDCGGHRTPARDGGVLSSAG